MEEAQGAVVIPDFTREDFLDSTSPYEWLHQFRGDKFLLNRMLQRLADQARSVKVYGFKGMYQDYERSLKQSGDGITDANLTRFEGQELELQCGAWTADDMGVSVMTPFGERFACPHPVLPVLRLVNIDTGAEKVGLAFRKGRQWRRLIADKKTIASANSIVALADSGVAVTSESAKYLVQYLSDLENANYELIPEKSSVGRLGWIEGEGFSPYVEGLIFDGEDSFRSYFHSVTQKGSMGEWLDFARKLRAEGGVPVRMILASSFASVLVKPVEALSFFVHLWGSESGVGKTVGLMLAASVWANPEMGRYIHSFNGTAVSQELSAGFVNSMPLILDEFQVLKDKKAFEQSVYMLSEGVGKGRGAKAGGVQRLQTWRNCILTSGEMPITNFVTGAGAVNRILEIECVEKLFAEPQAALRVIRDHYGWAGKAFVESLREDGNMEEAKAAYQIFYNEVVKSEATEKQAMAGALLLTADYLATEWLFKDGRALKFQEISPYLQKKKEVDVNERAYSYLCEAVASNAARFTDKDNLGEIWGMLDLNCERAYIIRSVFAKLCEAGGYSDRAVLSWLMRQNLIETSVEKKTGKLLPTVVKKSHGIAVRFVGLTLLHDGEENIFDMIEEQ